MSTAYRVTPRPLSRTSKPVRSERYKSFIRKQGSVVSGLGPCDAAHTGPHALGSKSNDLNCIPLTRKEHEAFHQDQQAFVALHGLDIPRIILRFNELYLFQELAGGHNAKV